MPREIGSYIWYPTWDSVQVPVTCPDCGGTGRIRFLYPDDTLGAIPCEGCGRGWFKEPTGTVPVYARTPKVELLRITGYEVDGDKVEYRSQLGSCSYRTFTEDRVFDDEAAALIHAKAKAEAADREEREKVSRKEKPTRSWSWHVHYHRSCARRAERDLAYHTAKLNVARVKAKEPEEKS